MASRPVQLPRYNFVTGGRETGPTITLGANEMLIVEGIHGLNPDLVPGLPPASVYRVYVSALTQLNLDRHNRVSTTDTRLIRRLVRDAATRSSTRRWCTSCRCYGRWPSRCCCRCATTRRSTWRPTGCCHFCIGSGR